MTSSGRYDYSGPASKYMLPKFLFKLQRMKSDRFHQRPAPLILSSLFLFSLFLFTGCSSLITSLVIEPTVSNLQRQTDFQLVCEGGPSYLLMVDSLIESDPTDQSLLIIGAKAYSAYLGALAECGAKPERLNAISTKARLYGTTLLSQQLPINPGDSLESLDNALKAVPSDNIEPLFWGTAAWTSWVFQQQGSPSSMVELVKIEMIMLKLAELDESFANGSIQLILGSYYGARPKLIGGKPELARTYFERGLFLSRRHYLPLQTAYAQTYCRMTMNKQLHDDLLQEVIAFPLKNAPNFALANQVAKAKAKKLLQENFFDE